MGEVSWLTSSPMGFQDSREIGRHLWGVSRHQQSYTGYGGFPMGMNLGSGRGLEAATGFRGEDILIIQLWWEYPRAGSEQSFMEIQRARVAEEVEEKGEEDEDISHCRVCKREAGWLDG